MDDLETEPSATDGGPAGLSPAPESDMEGSDDDASGYLQSPGDRIKLALTVLAVVMVLLWLRRVTDKAFRKGRRAQQWWKYGY